MSVCAHVRGTRVSEREKERKREIENVCVCVCVCACVKEGVMTCGEPAILMDFMTVTAERVRLRPKSASLTVP